MEKVQENRGNRFVNEIKAVALITMIVIAILTFFVTQSHAEPAAQWLFNENAEDTSGGGHHGIAFNVTPVPDRFDNENSAYEFNGYDSYVEISDGHGNSTLGEVVLINNYTISVWVYPYEDGIDNRQSPILWKVRGVPGNQDTLGLGYGYGAGGGYPADGDNESRFVFSTEDKNTDKDFLVPSDIFPPESWYNIQTTRIESDMIIEVYSIEGGLLSRNTLDIGDTVPYWGGAPLRIGNIKSPYSDHGGYGCTNCAGVFYGVIDDVEIYIGALTEEERRVLASPPASSVLDVSVDIKPGSYENPLNVKSKGVLPVAILGTVDLDVTDIDPASVTLAGVPAIRSSIDDVSDCERQNGDGYLDMVLKFRIQKIVAAIGDVPDGEQIPLLLTGLLLSDGLKVEGEDAVLIINKGRKK